MEKEVTAEQTVYTALSELAGSGFSHRLVLVPSILCSSHPPQTTEFMSEKFLLRLTERYNEHHQ